MQYMGTDREHFDINKDLFFWSSSFATHTSGL